MDYTVKLRADLLNEQDGTIDYPAATIGTAADYQVTPGPAGAIPETRTLLWKVFVGPAEIGTFRWVRDQDIIWVAGRDARLDLLMKGRIVQRVGPSDAIGRDNNPPLPIAVRLYLDNGLNVSFVSDQSSGLLNILLDSD